MGFYDIEQILIFVVGRLQFSIIIDLIQIINKNNNDLGVLLNVITLNIILVVLNICKLNIKTRIQQTYQA